MEWWNGQFTRYEVHFGYPDHSGKNELTWIPMPRHGSKRSLSSAVSTAKFKSQEHRLYARVVDAEKMLCIAMFFNEQTVPFTPASEPEALALQVTALSG